MGSSPFRRWPLSELLLSSLAVAAFLGALLASEGALRLLAPGSLQKLHPSPASELETYSETYGWKPRPGVREFRSGKWTTINRKGYRGREVDPDPPGDRTRVVMLGDSVAFGYRVDDRETFAHLLDAGDNGLEVVNLAVQGYGPDQALLRLEQEGLRYKPDVVILNFCLDNDFADSALPVSLYDGVYPKPYFRLEHGRLTKHDAHLKRAPLAKVVAWLGEESHLYNQLVSLARASDPPNAPTPASKRDTQAVSWMDRKEQALRDLDPILELTFALIARMRDLAAASNAAFLVLLHPSEASYRHGSPLVEAFFHAPLLEGTRVVDMRKYYRARKLPFRKIAQDPIGHLTPRGHRAAAEIIRDVLMRSGLYRSRAASVDPVS